MRIWKRYWLATARYALLLSFLAALQWLLLTWADQTDHATIELFLALRGVSGWIAIFLPLLAFAAALDTSSTLCLTKEAPQIGRLMSIGLAMGVLTYLWNGFIDPWADAFLLERYLTSAGGTADIHAQTQPWLAMRLAMPGTDPRDARILGWQFHISNSLAFLAMLLTWIGFLAGSRSSNSAHRWVFATMIVLAVAPMLVWSLELSSRFAVPAVLSAYGILAVPGVLLLGMLWVTWADLAHRDAPPGASA